LSKPINIIVKCWYLTWAHHQREIHGTCCGKATVKLGKGTYANAKVTKRNRTEQQNGSRRKCRKLDEKEECHDKISKLLGIRRHTVNKYLKT
jgi:hypothetical protein